ncbi:MAG: hypothetical protein WA666_12305 [Nitrospirota bacterium]
MNSLTPEMLKLARWLTAQEAAETNSPVTKNWAAFCVCEKLRKPLSALAGAEGYKALISRALTLARKEAPSLGTVRVTEDGVLEWPGVFAERDADESAGVALVGQLLGLLAIFIGESLTLRLVRDIWLDAPYECVGPETGSKP